MSFCDQRNTSARKINQSILSNINQYIAELIGTFFLVLTIGCTVIGGVAMAPLAIGAALMVVIFAGGHFNPAVTLAAWIRGKCPTKDVVPY